MSAHILIVEDESIVARDIQSKLKELGYATTVALSGESALQQAAQVKPDLALMDIRLQGGIDGTETARLLRDQFQLPVIYLTAYSDNDTLQRAKVAEPYGYILKPFDERELHVAVEVALYKKGMEESLAQTVSELKRANMELGRVMRQMEEANRLKDLFTDILRHDLLNPVSIIRDFAKLLLADSKDEGHRRILLKIRNNSEKLVEMIQAASTYARLGSAAVLERQQLNLDELFRVTVDNLRPLIESKGMSLVYASDGDHYAVVNPMIEEIFANLLSNAIKYSPEGSRIEAGSLELHGNYRFYVRDWGCGIADEDKPKVFTRFQRADKTGVRGSGLGLAIVQRIVELHQGKVWIEDNPEGGTVFYVEIPKQANEGRNTMTTDDKKTVLVVEDSPVQALALVKLLEQEGVNVLCASTGLSGIAMAKQYKPDVIILDIQMPEMDGLEACKRLKADAETVDIPIVMLTAHNEPATLVEGLNLGALDFIPKDAFSDTVLLETLKQLNIL